MKIFIKLHIYIFFEFMIDQFNAPTFPFNYPPKGTGKQSVSHFIPWNLRLIKMMVDILRRVRWQTAHEMGPTGTFFSSLPQITRFFCIPCSSFSSNIHDWRHHQGDNWMWCWNNMIPIFKELVKLQTNNIHNLSDL